MLEWFKQQFELWIERRDQARQCASCNTLKEQLYQANTTNSRLLEQIIELTNPKPQAVVEEREFEPIKPKIMPWHIKKQMLEAESRAEAKIKREQAKVTDLETEVMKLADEVLPEVEMAKSEPATPETSLDRAGMPPSYGMGIQDGSYGNGRNYAGGNGAGFGGPGQPGPMQGAGPSSDFIQTMMRVLQGMSQGGGRGMQDKFGGYNGMGGPRGTGYNFGTPVSGPSLFSGYAGVTGGSQAGQRLTDPYAKKQQSNFLTPNQPVDNSRPTPRG